VSFTKAIEAAKAINSQDLEVKCLRWLSLLLWDANQYGSVHRLAEKVWISPGELIINLKRGDY
ncbi:MAG: hypothetical protein OEW18_05085, partial [Candidatus Aminicenantes bacterium]|nr:hypothetical protein [Candidatus Aminicenantes bacterium]